MHIIHGGCHCGNISYVAELTNLPAFYNPRACSCELCTSHGASYVSDKNGTLTIKIKSPDEVSRYRQGSRIADFLVCRKCGVMIGVCYEEGNIAYGSINVRSADEYDAFGEAEVAHLTQQSDEERIRRWKELWFSDVLIEHETPGAAD